MDYATMEMSLDDYDEAISLWQQCEGVGLHLHGSDCRDELEQHLRRNPGLSFVARSGGKLVGAVLCGHDGRRGYLSHLAVAPPFRQRGIGRALVDRCLAALGAAGIRKCNIVVFASNTAGLEFWDSMGWTRRDDLVALQGLTSSDAE
ncbi:MAG: GNAT family N-acetyltransferase [Planctomycetota bacterium]|jgi:ribosomal protein S18 acetylase RimI-like enzyme